MNRIKTIVNLLLLVLLLSACGKEEVYQPDVGIDGYVYKAQRLQTVDLLMGGIKAEGDYVYYAQWEKEGDIIVIQRLPLKYSEADGRVQGKLQPETVLRIPYLETAVPDFIAERLQERLGGEEEILGWRIEEDGSLAEISKVSCLFSLLDFAVDGEGYFYLKDEVLIRNKYETEIIGNTLSCVNPDGETVYQVYYPDMADFALYGEGGVCVLEDERIILIGRDGAQIGMVSTSQYRGEEKPRNEQLIQDAEGHVYYMLCGYGGIQRGFEILADEGVRLQEVEGRFQEIVNAEVYASTERKMLWCTPYLDTLYEYDIENDSQREVLNWSDSGILSRDVQSIVRAAPGQLVVYCYDNSGTIYLLTRTSVEELPERETLTLFSYAPTDGMREAVLKFNKENDKYRIIIDDYGAEFSWFTREGEAPRVDMALVSQTPPDLLDMTFLDIHKYVEKDALEDLNPYLEESSVLSREDFLDCALEGMTIEGCLTCIPNEFAIEWLLGRKRQLGVLERWSMEEVYGLSEKYPESAHRLIGDIYGNIEKRDYLLSTFCAYYCLEEFIDWEERVCRYDSEEFAKLLRWVQNYGEDNSGREKIQSPYMPYIAEDVLLFYNTWLNFLGMADLEARCEDEVVLMGFPSSDGEGAYPVYVRDALAIAANSVHKEGAWEFVEYFLSMSEPSLGFSTKKEWIYKEVQDAACQEYYVDEDVSKGMGIRKQKGGAIIEGRAVPYYALAQEQADALLKAVQSADFRPRSPKERMILQIISAEAEGYYSGDKSLEEVTGIIQNRVQLLLQEQKK